MGAPAFVKKSAVCPNCEAHIELGGHACASCGPPLNAVSPVISAKGNFARDHFSHHVLIHFCILALGTIGCFAPREAARVPSLIFTMAWAAIAYFLVAQHRKAIVPASSTTPYQSAQQREPWSPGEIVLRLLWVGLLLFCAYQIVPGGVGGSINPDWKDDSYFIRGITFWNPANFTSKDMNVGLTVFLLWFQLIWSTVRLAANIASYDESEGFNRTFRVHLASLVVIIFLACFAAGTFHPLAILGVLLSPLIFVIVCIVQTIKAGEDLLRLLRGDQK